MPTDRERFSFTTEFFNANALDQRLEAAIDRSVRPLACTPEELDDQALKLLCVLEGIRNAIADVQRMRRMPYEKFEGICEMGFRNKLMRDSTQYNATFSINNPTDFKLVIQYIENKLHLQLQGLLQKLETEQAAMSRLIQDQPAEPNGATSWPPPPGARNKDGSLCD